ncbi:hypothetical protein CALCODRAFT_509841 [Calocera cornea HHB12733]|uniref:Uncharacterized protein n=1 Tax=Calocera cornea HHB12733 TaxID=1353952 RepID=A0A165EZY6_9BASI|nr:hypothetical protein CALCODRAFT_509841 [Calocera cornea HHB12733]
MSYASRDFTKSRGMHDPWKDSFLQPSGRYGLPLSTYAEELVSDLVSPKLKPNPTPKSYAPSIPRAGVPPLPQPLRSSFRRSTSVPRPAASTKRVDFDMFHHRVATNAPWSPSSKPVSQREFQKMQQKEMESRKNAILLSNAQQRATTVSSAFPGAYAMQQRLATISRARGPVHQAVPAAPRFETPQHSTSWHTNVEQWPLGNSGYVSRRVTPFVDNLAQVVNQTRHEQSKITIAPWSSHRLQKPRPVFRRMVRREDAYVLPAAQPTYSPALPQAWTAVTSAAVRGKLIFGSGEPPDMFSLRSSHAVEYEDQRFPTALHLLFFLRLEPGLHAANVLQDFMELPNPQVAAGRHPGALRKDWWPRPALRWESVRLVVRSKLEQHEEVRKALWETGRQQLCDGEDDSTENLVGKALMEFREEMRQRWERM